MDKKTNLKRVLKPLVRQCVQEVLLEEGILSNIISEVAIGLSPLLIENKKMPNDNISENSRKQELLKQQRMELEEEKNKMIKEQKRKILNATGFGKEIFEGVEALSHGGSAESPTGQQGALSGVDPKDPGVDISALMALSGHKWDKLI